MPKDPAYAELECSPFKSLPRLNSWHRYPTQPANPPTLAKTYRSEVTGGAKDRLKDSRQGSTMKESATGKDAAAFGGSDLRFQQYSTGLALDRAFWGLALSREVSPKDRKQQRWWWLPQKLFSNDVELDAEAVDKASLYLYDTVLRWDRWALWMRMGGD